MIAKELENPDVSLEELKKYYGEQYRSGMY